MLNDSRTGIILIPYTIKNFILLLCGVFSSQLQFAQQAASPFSIYDSIPGNQIILENPVPPPGIAPAGSFHVPVSIIIYGIIVKGNSNKGSLSSDINLQSQVKKKFAGFQTRVDDYLQFTPVALVYLLNAAGIKGRHDMRDRSMLCLLSGALTFTFVRSLKGICNVQRPDSDNRNSFPSGHTAAAFSSAYILQQEYKHHSPWYGIAGYTMATGTGVLRILNNRHWLSDVIAGAGFGILSGQLAYLLYPKVKQWLFGEKKQGGLNMALAY
jgi:hypothetical protein